MENEMFFISCSYKKENGNFCPLAEQKACRSTSIAIDEDGLCINGKIGPFKKNDRDNYVELKSCKCQKCSSWEFDEVENRGKCSLTEEIVINSKGKCSAFANQISEPENARIV